MPWVVRVEVEGEEEDGGDEEGLEEGEEGGDGSEARVANKEVDGRSEGEMEGEEEGKGEHAFLACDLEGSSASQLPESVGGRGELTSKARGRYSRTCAKLAVLALTRKKVAKIL